MDEDVHGGLQPNKSHQRQPQALECGEPSPLLIADDRHPAKNFRLPKLKALWKNEAMDEDVHASPPRKTAFCMCKRRPLQKPKGQRLAIDPSRSTTHELPNFLLGHHRSVSGSRHC